MGMHAAQTWLISLCGITTDTLSSVPRRQSLYYPSTRSTQTLQHHVEPHSSHSNPFQSATLLKSAWGFCVLWVTAHRLHLDPLKPMSVNFSNLERAVLSGSVGTRSPDRGNGSLFHMQSWAGWDQTEQEVNQPCLILGLFTQWANGGTELKKCERWKKGKGRAHAFGLGLIWSELWLENLKGTVQAKIQTLLSFFFRIFEHSTKQFSECSMNSVSRTVLEWHEGE